MISNDELRKDAELYKAMYLTNQCTREEAKLHILPYLDRVNEVSIEIAKKFNQKPKKVSFASYVR
jgi:hypothetical protein